MGSILLKTRNRRVAANFADNELLELQEMTHLDGIEILRNMLAKPEILTDLFAILNLLERLAYPPLAIIQAAAYITMNDNTIEQYLKILNDSEEESLRRFCD